MNRQQLILADTQTVTPRSSRGAQMVVSSGAGVRTERRKFNSASALSAYENKREGQGFAVFMELEKEDEIGRATYNITLEKIQ